MADMKRPAHNHHIFLVRSRLACIFLSFGSRTVEHLPVPVTLLLEIYVRPKAVC